MEQFCLFQNREMAEFLVEPEAFEGVRRITRRVAQDIELVTDKCPEMRTQISELSKTQVVFAATVGSSPLLERWQKEGKWDAGGLAGKHETWQITMIQQPFPENPKVKQALIIAGSDKRGTIYGLFHLSERCGVSPLVYWGDVKPQKRVELCLELDTPILSKEPSVKYRGFFINDEWPAFGSWCQEHFGGVNAKAYEEIFLLLLRLKGNYLWPAMWNSVFSEDGPGLANAELADIYGVIIGLSHHEPMCRAGAEWQRIYQNYGTDNSWSFITNREAISEFWKDGILRNQPFENLITIGMRGENDSKLLPEHATLKDNIQVVKDAILTQHELIRRYLNDDLSQVPRMLAIYKEVEDFYYGDETCEGLKDWEELKDVIFMLSDDNFGNTRGLPVPGDQSHPGGYGMYYHFDYHGCPISYEWQNSTRLTKVWEQMTAAHEHGVRDLWIVNVGDIKGAEYPLCYFMELAYDYETWSWPNQIGRFVRDWLDQQFGEQVSPEQMPQLFRLLRGWTTWSAARKPEAMNEGIYEPCNYREGDRVWNEVHGLLELAEELRMHLPAECLPAYESMIYYPAVATFNLILMHVEAGMNAHFAKRGSLAANAYGKRVKQRIRQDAAYISAYHKLSDGKWNHMMDSAHTGFRSWDARDWQYPVIRQVIPIPEAKIVAGYRGSHEYHLGKHWQDGAPFCNEEFTRPDTTEVLLDLDSRGNVDFTFTVQSDCPWVKLNPVEGAVSALGEGRATIHIGCDREQLKGRQQALIDIQVQFANGESTTSRFALLAGMEEETAYPKGVFLEQFGYIAIDAVNYAEKSDVREGGFQEIHALGRMGDAVKAFPVTESWIHKAKAPSISYYFAAKETREYKVYLYLAPENPRTKGGPMRCQLSVNDGEKVMVETVSRSLCTDWYCSEWSRGVLDNIRIIETRLPVRQGVNRLTFYAGDPGIVLERIVLCQAQNELPYSYFGPQESWRI